MSWFRLCRQMMSGLINNQNFGSQNPDSLPHLRKNHNLELHAPSGQKRSCFPTDYYSLLSVNDNAFL